MSNQSTTNVQEETIHFQFDDQTHYCFLAYDANTGGKRPGILICPEWWGLNDYIRERARMLARLGYAAMAVDVFGSAKLASNPQEAMEAIRPFSDPIIAKQVIVAALAKFREVPQVDTEKTALIGYCFGGYMALNAGMSGVPAKGVVAFHPSLGNVKAHSRKLSAQFLICNGADDQFETAHFDSFQKMMKQAGVAFDFKIYPHATHAFTNPGSTEVGKKFGLPLAYNEDADRESWNEMQQLFKKIF